VGPTSGVRIGPRSRTWARGNAPRVFTGG